MNPVTAASSKVTPAHQNNSQGLSVRNLLKLFVTSVLVNPTAHSHPFLRGGQDHFVVPAQKITHIVSARLMKDCQTDATLQWITAHKEEILANTKQALITELQKTDEVNLDVADLIGKQMPSLSDTLCATNWDWTIRVTREPTWFEVTERLDGDDIKKPV